MKYCYGNWKLNTNLTLAEIFKNTPKFDKIELGLAPSFPYLPIFKEKLPEHIKIGAQNCSTKLTGAFTGEVSVKMLKELKIDFVILGHSERRHLFCETELCLQEKLKICQQHKLKVIYCVGETLKQKENDETISILKNQLKNLTDLQNVILAYEPVWAINTGKAANPKDVKECVDFIKKELNNPIVLYGGSVSSKNAKDFSDVCDGFLVGNASLNEEFFEIADVLNKS
ncbi:triosephosphate isomerase [Tubulinosema ratisbonensis]|uniref:Triosephosphate isomerase n=1 Tax=Tubulinosema ratisbonensis TaxID=291195 RepID=A0A437AJR0_9MICR|nr:triosephosphate isomerase [Tubulinosema ratisbonensis]